MPTKDEIVAWVRQQALLLHQDMTYCAGDPMLQGRGGYWEAADYSLKGQMMARAAAGLEFLRLYAGADSAWFHRATTAYDSKGDNQSLESGIHAVGDILELWADQAEQGIVPLPTAVAEGVRAIASTDVMEQVRALIADRKTHPAGSIVLAGAALETALRAAVEERQLNVVGSPGIAAYGQALRTAGIISAQDMKDLEQMAGLRNEAAHGKFDSLSPERAGLMEQQVNLFLARLLELMR